ncbi:uncharacterized protein LOC126092180 [Schistocerca cancellata]|uniref:uncharacterized protein LOC126092180 n=1 Tax=Schistocerca cancellata TaxID=274614 RepID=UPI0021177700|nr:uncharacterized protein LOC126092180 [Schistocerca cancellata]
MVHNTLARGASVVYWFIIGIVSDLHKMPKFSLKQLAMIAIALDEEEEERRPKRVWVRNMLKGRECEGEFHTLYKELEEEESSFFKYFRMPKQQFFYLLSKIQTRITKKNSRFRCPISPRQKLMVCLRYLATGDSLLTLSFSYRLGHSTVHNIVKEVCQAIIDSMLPEVMPTPTEEDWQQIAEQFLDLWNFPNCIGAIDGKHIQIVAPPNSGSQFYNYKQTFSIVLLALVDANYKFINVDIGSYGKNSDGGIFAHSKLGKALELGKLQVPGDKRLPGTDVVVPHVIVGDEAYPLKTYLLRPYPKSQASGDIAMSAFNARLSRARRVSENAFGQLAQKFRIFFRRINSMPENVDKIVMATCILHNYIKENVYAQTEAANGTLVLQELTGQGGSATSSAFVVREHYKDFFNSPIGRLPWA